MTKTFGWGFMVLALGLSVATAPSRVIAAPNADKTAYAACRHEAEWPAYHTLAYQHWNERQRESVVPADLPQVASMQALCRAMFEAKSDPAALLRSCQDDVAATRERFGAAADAHARRMLAICRVATGA